MRAAAGRAMTPSAAAAGPKTQRAVEPAHEREYGHVIGFESRGEARARHLSVGEGTSHRERLEAQPAGRGMILGKSSRKALQHRFLAQAPEPAAHGRRLHDALEPARIPRDRGAESLERGPRRHPAPSADERSARLQVEVEAGATTVGVAADLGGAASVEEPTGGVRLVGRLVASKTNVAMQPEHRALRIPDHLRGEARHAQVHFFDEVRQRLPDVLIVDVAVRFEPGLVVVAFEATKEDERFGSEVLHEEELLSWRSTSE